MEAKTECKHAHEAHGLRANNVHYAFQVGEQVLKDIPAAFSSQSFRPSRRGTVKTWNGLNDKRIALPSGDSFARHLRPLT